MRQQLTSNDDIKLCTALENMRYKNCTADDIEFLRSRISSDIGKVSVCSNEFRNISIITAKNVQWDEINRLGTLKYAIDTNQELTHFFSKDSLPKSLVSTERKKFQKNRSRRLTSISEKLQNTLWNLPHSCSDKHIAGKLSLCIGMPMMIKCNVATELCITNGQEATVIGWQSKTGSKGQVMLDTLFVKLSSPPSKIKPKDLPENVVPLTCSTYTITCKLPDESSLRISRTQVDVLPNFAMTDFASQGKTRIYNPVDLNNCRSHQAYYTALSRSASAAGTVILQGFDISKITGRASGALRQEFRELEVMDEITLLKYESKLHNSVIGETRNALIHTYHMHKGLDYIPSAVHPAIKWNKKDVWLESYPNELHFTHLGYKNKYDNVETLDNTLSDVGNNVRLKRYLVNSESTVTREKKHRKTSLALQCKNSSLENSITQKKTKKPKTQKQSNSLSSVLQCEDCSIQKSLLEAKKNQMTSSAPQMSPESSVQILKPHSPPKGFSWDENSCAYDSVLSIIHAIWETNYVMWTEIFNLMNDDLLGTLASDFIKNEQNLMTLESARDNLRRKLASQSHNCFRWGMFAATEQILAYLLTTPSITIKSVLKCEYGHEIEENNNTCCLITASFQRINSIQDWVSDLKEPTHFTCYTCGNAVHEVFTIEEQLPLIALEFANRHPVIESELLINVNGCATLYKLRGLIYYNDDHFTSQIIHENGMTWFHDGMVTHSYTIYEGHINNIHSLNHCRGKLASCAIYSKVYN